MSADEWMPYVLVAILYAGIGLGIVFGASSKETLKGASLFGVLILAALWPVLIVAAAVMALLQLGHEA